MTTPTFSVNGGSAIPGVVANWNRTVKRRNNDGSIEYQPYAEHVWDIPSMAMATYLTLQALNGQVLSSLDTTNHSDRNNGATYTGAEIISVRAQHLGLRAAGVRVLFKVDIS